MKRASALLVVSFLVGSLTEGQTTSSGASAGLTDSTPDVGGSHIPGTGPALFPRVTQDDVTNGSMTLLQIRTAGQRIFSTPFNKFDGMGDGPPDPNDPKSPGGRPTIGGNGTWLRVNGLDSQSCVECHFIQSNRSIPPGFAVGGVGGIAASAMPDIQNFDLSDSDATGAAEIDGRKINPPFIFGSGGVELVAKEMTTELQGYIQEAMDNPDTVISLDTKAVNFGTIFYDSAKQELDTTGVVGVEPDLVVRPFGRKGNNATVRKFDIGAIQFHMGIQPEEVVGSGVDADGDGVVDEILIGELSAMHIFEVTSDRPTHDLAQQQVNQGFQLFNSLGCATCHMPAIHTNSNLLPLAYPEVESDPLQNVYINIDLQGGNAGFAPSPFTKGIVVPMFSDLKRHDVGTAETTGDPLDNVFITPRLWGVADTAPYMHDGSALTITEAILLHGNEALSSQQAFVALDQASQDDLLTFLDGLRAPVNPNSDLP